ncbi:Uncharacterised protein [Vibrio cincinnatiensis]|nr:Uncharacterised protein [Vibrio cincinnatiensis]
MIVIIDESNSVSYSFLQLSHERQISSLDRLAPIL